MISSENYSKALWEYRALKEFAVLARERTLEVRIQPIERVLPEVRGFIPWVERHFMLVCTWEGRLYSNAAIHRATLALAFAAGGFDGTALFIEADEIRLTRTWSATISFPVQVLEGSLLEFKYLDEQTNVQAEIRNCIGPLTFPRKRFYRLTRVKLVTE